MAHHKHEPKRSPSEALALAAANYGILIAAVRKTIRDREKWDDFAQSAWFDLYRAAELYDTDEGNTFESYAYSCVRSSIILAWRRGRCIGHVPDKVSRVFRRLERRGETNTTSSVEAVLAQAFAGRDGEADRWDARAFFTFSLGERSLSEVVVEADSTRPITLGDTIAADSPTADELAESALNASLARRMLAAANLTDRERTIVELRYMDDTSVTLLAVGERLGISRQRVQQIEAVALRKLRDAATKIAR